MGYCLEISSPGCTVTSTPSMFVVIIIVVVVVVVDVVVVVLAAVLVQKAKSIHHRDAVFRPVGNARNHLSHN